MFEPVHDERRIKLDLPTDPHWRGKVRGFQKLVDAKAHQRSVQEAEQALVTDLNRPMREAAAKRTLRNPGASPEAKAKAYDFLASGGEG